MIEGFQLKMISRGAKYACAINIPDTSFQGTSGQSLVGTLRLVSCLPSVFKSEAFDLKRGTDPAEKLVGAQV